MTDDILVPNFFRPEWHGDTNLYKSLLGWNGTSVIDARSDDPREIFRYYVEIVGFNVLFYWLKTREWYNIYTEHVPVLVRKIYRNPNWDGEYEYFKSGLDGAPCTSADGELLATFDEPEDIWDNLRIDGVPIGEVLKNSLITDLD